MTLIIDTSSSLQYICLLDENNLNIIEETSQISKNDHSSSLLVNINNVLIKNHKKIKDVNKIVIGIGPGSYTGTRVGLTIAKSLAYTLNLPLYQISSLVLLSSGYSGTVLVKMDAKKNRFFCTMYNNKEIVLEEKNRELDELNQLVPDLEYTLVDENNMKVDCIKVLQLASLSKNLHTLSPNYLKEV